MIYVGIDVASDKHDFCIVRDTGESLSSGRIANSRDGYEKLLGAIGKAKERSKDDKVRIGLESTGPYSLAICDYLRKRFPDLVLINPTLTHKFMESETLHYAKTDAADAAGICRFLASRKFKAYAGVSYHTTQIRSLYRCLTDINRQLNMLKNRLLQMVRTAFPEYLSKKETLGDLDFRFLAAFPTPQAILASTPKKMTGKMRKQPYSRFTEKTAERITGLAKNTGGTESRYTDFEIRFAAEHILFLEEQKSEIKEKLGELLREEYSYMLDIPDAGTVTVAGIVGEIGNIENFRSPDSIVAYAGLDPFVYESGKYKADKAAIMKHGSSYLRNALVTLARSMYMHGEPTVKEFVDRKRKEGKKYNCAINHAARKLCRLIFHKLKSREAFDPGKWKA